MQITITISDKTIKNAVENMLDGNIYEQYDTDVRDAAGVPKKAALLKTVMADEKFMAALAKEISSRVDPEDYLYDYVWDVPCKPVAELLKKCDAAYDTVDAIQLKKEAEEAKKREEAAEEATVARLIAILKKQGYKLTKE